MRNRITSHLRGNAVAYVALFAALGGTSYAAIQLAPGSVTSKALANGAVTHSKLAAHSVTEGNLAKRQLTAADFKPGALQSALGVVTGAKGAPGAAGPHGSGGAAGAVGGAGKAGPQGPAGHDGSSSVAFRARSTAGVTAPHGAATNVPLSSGSWTQAASDLNLITGSVTIGVPQTCTGSYGNAVVMSIDGVPNTFAVAPTAPANTTVTIPLVVSEVMEPGADTKHTITAKLQNSCTKSGEDYVLTDAKFDVVNFH
jgi:hypothetical protein